MSYEHDIDELWNFDYDRYELESKYNPSGKKPDPYEPYAVSLDHSHAHQRIRRMLAQNKRGMPKRI